jgi:hypothetical protein
MEERDYSRGTWLTRSRLALCVAGVLVAVGAVLIVKALGATGPAPRPRLGGLLLVVAGGLVALAPAVVLRDLRAGIRTALRPVERWHLLALTAVIAAGLGIRLAYLGLAMRYDESVTFLTFASQHLSAGLWSYPFPNNHFLNTLLIHFAWRALGNDPEVIRLPALVAGVALVPALYVAGRALYDRTVGLVAAAVAVPSGVLVEYSVNARGYSMVALTTIVLLPLGVYAIRRGSGAAWLIWAVIAALGLWSVPTMVYGLAIVVFWLALVGVFDIRRERRLFAFVGLENALLVAGGITYVLYQPALGQGGFLYHEAVVPPGFVEKVWHAFRLGYGPLWWLLVAGVPAAIVLHRRVARVRAPLWLAIGIVVPLSIAASHRIPPFVRTWLFLLPLLLLLAAAGLTAAARVALRSWSSPRARLAALALPVVFAASLAAALGENDLYTEDDPPTRGADQAVAYLRERWHPGEDGLAIGRFTAPAIEYYFRRDGIEPNAAVGPLLGIAPAQPGRPTYLALLEARPPTLAEAEAYYPLLRGSRLVKTVDGGAVYRSPPAPKPSR